MNHPLGRDTFAEARVALARAVAASMKDFMMGKFDHLYLSPARLGNRDQRMGHLDNFIQPLCTCSEATRGCYQEADALQFIDFWPRSAPRQSTSWSLAAFPMLKHEQRNLRKVMITAGRKSVVVVAGDCLGGCGEERGGGDTKRGSQL